MKDIFDFGCAGFDRTSVFSLKGRVSPDTFIFYSLILTIIAYQSIGFLEPFTLLSEEQINRWSKTDLIVRCIFAFLGGVISIWVCFCLAVRRLHDTNRSGWFCVPICLTFIPILFLTDLETGITSIVGNIYCIILSWVWLLILYKTKGNDGINIYGEKAQKLKLF